MMAGLLLVSNAEGQRSLADAAHLQPAVLHIADDSVATPAASLEDALHAAFTQADVVFSGEVTKVEHTEAAVLVHFLVEEGVSGIATGTEYILREWPGLWADDADRYIEGERRLMLLHAASAAGYASPIAGSRGSVRLHGGTADLRLLETDVAPSAQLSAKHLSPQVAAQAGTAGTADNSSIDGAVINDLLHAWQRSASRQGATR